MKGFKLDKSHYINKSYDTKERFNSYWHQIHEITLHQPSSILEIGIGNGFLCEYLRARSYNVTTCDIDFTLKPDIAGSVLSLPCEPESYDLVVCFQVLEHLDYQFFKKALIQLFKVTKNHAIISLPDTERCYRIFIDRFFGLNLKKYISAPWKKPKEHVFDGQHYWEIGKKEYPLKRICSDIISVGFLIERTYRVFEYPYHRFFIIKKNSSALSKSLDTFSKWRLGDMEEWRDKFKEDIFNINHITLKLKKVIGINA